MSAMPNYLNDQELLSKNPQAGPIYVFQKPCPGSLQIMAGGIHLADARVNVNKSMDIQVAGAQRALRVTQGTSDFSIECHGYRLMLRFENHEDTFTLQLLDNAEFKVTCLSKARFDELKVGRATQSELDEVSSAYQLDQLRGVVKALVQCLIYIGLKPEEDQITMILSTSVQAINADAGSNSDVLVSHLNAGFSEAFGFTFDIKEWFREIPIFRQFDGLNNGTPTSLALAFMLSTRSTQANPSREYPRNGAAFLDQRTSVALS